MEFRGQSKKQYHMNSSRDYSDNPITLMRKGGGHDEGPAILQPQLVPGTKTLSDCTVCIILIL